MIALLQTATAICPGRSCSFNATSGTAPYTYSVQFGGAGGTIDSDGFYTAPSQPSLESTKVYDTVMVQDADGAIATAKILVGSALIMVCDIIQKELGLWVGQVFLWDQKLNLGNDDKLYIAVSEMYCKPLSNSNDHDDDGNSIQSTNFSVGVDLDIMSRSQAAVQRKEEVIMALRSDYAERQQALNSFRIFPLSTGFRNLSQVDGAAIPYRFNISLQMQYFISKTKPVAYYDDFSDIDVTTDP